RPGHGGVACRPADRASRSERPEARRLGRCWGAVEALRAGGARAASTRAVPMTALDPFAEVRAEFVGGLARRIETMEGALAGLAGRFDGQTAETLYRAPHSPSGTAARFGAGDLAGVAGGPGELARGWLQR